LHDHVVSEQAVEFDLGAGDRGPEGKDEY